MLLLHSMNDYYYVGLLSWGCYLRLNKSEDFFIVEREMLDPFFKPKSVAIIGATDRPNSLGRSLTENVLNTFLGKVYLVNIKGGSFNNIIMYKSILDVEEDVDLALIITPSHTVVQILNECGMKGVKGAIIFSGGFSEIGHEGAELERKVINIAKKYDIRIIGPNCVGIIDNWLPLNATFISSERWLKPPSGNVSIVSQSGALGSLILDVSATLNIGFSKFISLGNSSDIGIADAVEYLANDPTTKVIGIYLESVKEGRKLLNTLKKITHHKPVIILKGGIGEKGSAAAKSHTAAMSGPIEVLDGALKQVGAIRAKSFSEFISLLNIFGKSKLIKGDRVAIITNAGGMGVLVTDSLESRGILLSEFTTTTYDKLKEAIPSYMGINNPIDVAGDADSYRYDKILRILEDAPEVDIIVTVVLPQTPALDSENFSKMIVNHCKNSNKPLLLLISGGDYAMKMARWISSENVPVFFDPDELALSLKEYIKYNKYITSFSNFNNLLS
ncbi:MAG: CoA-binding protein [Thermoprotei archaeon]